jgi:FtsP/CotA-like multicopper oxidase with cupredoxin domain/plastocyanin
MDRTDRATVSLISVVLALGALALGLAAVFIAGDSSAGGSSPAAAGATPAQQLELTLADLKITPAMPEVPAGPVVVHVTNSGSQVHNLSFPALDKDSGDIQPGQTATMDLGVLAAGSYDMVCTIAGHAAAGMTGMLHVGSATAAAGSAAGSSAAAPTTTMDVNAMDAAMEKVAKEFPATTAGHGGEPLEPVIQADGTKEFDLTAKVVDWEVAPGKVVKAWTYNGVVPAPTIKVDVGDKVRVMLKNELPESTSLHFHGVRVPNSMDGVDPYTQDPIKPGQSFTYEFTALEPAVGMYHSHHDAQIQVPNGMAGAFLIGDMPLPASLADAKVTQTVNMVLNDAGTIGLSLNGKSFPATEPYKLKVGQSMIVNYFNEGLLAHPMHLHQPKGYLIAKDGVPLAAPEPGDTFVVAPGERLTVLYTATDPGVWAWHCHILNHAEGPQGMFGMVTALIVEP